MVHLTATVAARGRFWGPGERGEPLPVMAEPPGGSGAEAISLEGVLA
jgi:hypothetical protein